MWSLDIWNMSRALKPLLPLMGQALTSLLPQLVQRWFIEYIHLVGHIIHIDHINSDKLLSLN